MTMEKMISAAYTGLYVLFLCAFLLLAAVSCREELPTYARDPPFLRPFRRMALFLYRRLLERREKRRRKGKDLLIPGEEGVRNDLQILYPSLKAGRQEILYQLGKIEKILLLSFAGIVLAGTVHVRALCSGILQEGGQVERAGVGGEDRILQVTALAPEMADEKTDPGRQDRDMGTYTVTVRARQYTRKEAEERAQKILALFPDSLLGDNEAADRIRTPLTMPAAADTAPFGLSWESSRYAVMDTDGSIFNSEYTDRQAEKVELTAILTYGDEQFRKKMTFTVRAPVRDQEEQLRGEIGTALRSAEKESASENYYTLPSSAGGQTLTWRERVEDVSAGVLILGIVSCILAWYVMDSRLHERTRERQRQLAIDYPQLTSKFVLYLGAGMSVRNVFYTCAAQYREKTAAGQETDRRAFLTGASPKGQGAPLPSEGSCRKGDPLSGGGGRTRSGTHPGRKGIRYLYEEILLVCNELDSGVPEAEAYMHFGRRCHLRQYTRLCSLLVQNLRRGNDTLLQVLQEEAQSSFEERKNLARELGEEAGTKLLLPMMIMLGITMLIIIVPAYFSFAI